MTISAVRKKMHILEKYFERKKAAALQEMHDMRPQTPIDHAAEALYTAYTTAKAAQPKILGIWRDRNNLPEEFARNTVADFHLKMMYRLPSLSQEEAKEVIQGVRTFIKEDRELGILACFNEAVKQYVAAQQTAATESPAEERIPRGKPNKPNNGPTR